MVCCSASWPGSRSKGRAAEPTGAFHAPDATDRPSVSVGADVFPAVACPDRPPGNLVDRVLDEADGAVGELGIDAAGVKTAGAEEAGARRPEVPGVPVGAVGVGRIRGQSHAGDWADGDAT